jgi:hypothetical protein
VKRVSNSSDTNLEFERYVIAMCALTLMLMLVVGAAGYAGITGISRAFRAAGNANVTEVAPVKRGLIPRS